MFKTELPNFGRSASSAACWNAEYKMKYANVLKYNDILLEILAFKTEKKHSFRFMNNI